MIHIDMEMPDSCRECWFLKYDINTGETSCGINDMPLTRYFQALSFEGLHEECPLIDVPDIHVGKLIDRQAAIDILEVAINDDWEFDYAKDRMMELSTQPEIIKCKDCVWSMTGDFSEKFFCSLTGALAWAEPDSFCSHAVRKINGSDWQEGYIKCLN